MTIDFSDTTRSVRGNTPYEALECGRSLPRRCAGIAESLLAAANLCTCRFICSSSRRPLRTLTRAATPATKTPPQTTLTKTRSATETKSIVHLHGVRRHLQVLHLEVPDRSGIHLCTS